MSEAALERGVRPIARVVSYAVVGVPPEVMESVLVEAIPRALQRRPETG